MTHSAKADTAPPHLNNALFMADRISCACNRDAVSATVEPDVYRDTCFGNAWSWMPPPGAAVYGRTEDLPPTPVDEFGSGRYLRVPYRRIPVIDVSSISELLYFTERVESRTSEVRGVWRGQARHYNLPREKDDRLRLYGSASIEEPSLLPSATRSNIYFPDLFLTWAGLLDLYIDERLGRLENLPRSSRTDLAAETMNFSAGYNYRLWGFATAQHYGLPSVGLDVTHNILVALFFALHCFSTDKSTGAMTLTRATDADNPIIYGMGGFQYDLFEDEKLAPDWLLCARPEAQAAMFFGTGWGDAKNKAADRIYVAFRLVNHTQWESPLSGRQVFPHIAEDDFLDFLLRSRTKHNNPMVRDILHRIYFVP